MEIKDHPNYLIYSDGRVFSKKSNKFMKPFCGENYKSVNLDKKTKKIHRLVAENYLKQETDLQEVDHINRNKHDNRVENLRWVTKKENQNNRGLQKNNTTGFKWICVKDNRSYRFNRKDCKVKSSKSLSKLLCYSFFYLIKNHSK
jgi:hypothetical protein